MGAVLSLWNPMPRRNFCSSTMAGFVPFVPKFSQAYGKALEDPAEAALSYRLIVTYFFSGLTFRSEGSGSKRDKMGLAFDGDSRPVGGDR